MSHPSRLRWAALSLVLFALHGCGGSSTVPEGTDLAPMVSIVNAQKQPLSPSLTVTGTLAPRRVALVHAETPGLIVTGLLAEEGQSVRAGQLLARLSSDRQRAELSGARGELQRAEQALDRAQTLGSDGALAREEAETAAARHAEALARVRTLEIDVRRAEVRAPISGFLQRRRVEIGEIVGDGPLFEIAAGGELELVADLSEGVWRQARIGQGAAITLADGRQISGRIRRMSGALDEGTRLGRAWIGLNAPPEGLVSGAGASARLRGGDAEHLAIPQTSLLYDQHGAYVFVVRNGKAVRQHVSLGVQAEALAEITSGLKAGDVVVARAGSLLRNGDPVRVADAKGAGR